MKKSADSNNTTVTTPLPQCYVLHPRGFHRLKFKSHTRPNPHQCILGIRLMKCTHAKVSARTLIFTFNRETTIKLKNVRSSARVRRSDDSLNLLGHTYTSQFKCLWLLCTSLKYTKLKGMRFNFSQLADDMNAVHVFVLQSRAFVKFDCRLYAAES